MPHIAISLYPGRDNETKRDIAEKMQQYYVEAFSADEDVVSVSIAELPDEEFSETSSNATSAMTSAFRHAQSTRESSP